MRGENNGSIDPATGRSRARHSRCSSSNACVRSARRYRRSLPSRRSRRSTSSSTDSRRSTHPRSSSPAITTAGSACPPLSGARSLPTTTASAAPVAVISFRYWERRFGARPDVLGKTIQINRIPTRHRRRDAAGFRRRDAGWRIARCLRAARALLALSTRPRRPGAALVLVDSHHGPARAGRDAGAGARLARADLSGNGARRLACGPVARRPSRRADARTLRRSPPTRAPRGRTTRGGSSPGRCTF